MHFQKLISEILKSKMNTRQQTKIKQYRTNNLKINFADNQTEAKLNEGFLVS